MSSRFSRGVVMIAMGARKPRNALFLCSSGARGHLRRLPHAPSLSLRSTTTHMSTGLTLARSYASESEGMVRDAEQGLMQRENARKEEPQQRNQAPEGSAEVGGVTSSSLLPWQQCLSTLQRSCLAESSEGEGAAMWQRCADVLLHCQGEGSRCTEGIRNEAVVDTLESLAAKTEAAVLEGSQRTRTEEPTPAAVGLCILDWMLYACLASSAPVPLAVATYQARRSLLHHLSLKETGGIDERMAALLAVKVPWPAKDVPASMARYLLDDKLHHALSSMETSALNNELLFAFDTFFTVLLLDNAEDASTEKAAQQIAGRQNTKARVLSSSAALQLLLLEGMQQFLTYIAQVSLQEETNALHSNEAVHHAEHLDTITQRLQAYPMLAWLLQQNSSGELVNVHDTVKVCLGQLAQTDSAQEGLVRSWSVYVACHCCVRENHEPGVMQALLFLQGDVLNSLVYRQETTPSQQDVTQRLERVVERMANEHAENKIEASLSLCNALVTEGAAHSSGIAVEGKPSNLDADSGALLLLELLSTFLSRFVLEGPTRSDPPARHGHPNVSRDTTRQFLLRALLQPFRTIPNDASRVNPALSFSPAVWFITNALHAVQEAQRCTARQDHASQKRHCRTKDPWARATEQCTTLLASLLPALDQSVHYFSHKASAPARTPVQKSKARNVHRQVSEMQGSMQACWLLILRAVTDGGFHCRGSDGERHQQSLSLGKSTAAGARPTGLGSCPVLTDVVLPFYVPRYWRRDTLESHVTALDAWGMAEQLREVMLTVQRREARMQERVLRELRVHRKTFEESEAAADKAEGVYPEVTETAMESTHPSAKQQQQQQQRQPTFVYTPALSLHACDVILAHSIERLQDPRTAATTVKYMLISLRAARLARGTASEGASDSHGMSTDDRNAMDPEEGSFEVDDGGEINLESAAQEKLWLERITTTHIPRVHALFAEKGIDHDGSWLRE